VASSELDALNEFAGARVRLRGVRTDDIDAFIAMDADTDGARRSHDAYLPRTDDRSRAWLEQQVTRDRTDDTCFLAIERLDSLLVGSISVGQAKPRWGRFSHGLAIAASDRRQGFGTEAVKLLLRFYFGELRYQNATSIYGFNDASLAHAPEAWFPDRGPSPARDLLPGRLPRRDHRRHHRRRVLRTSSEVAPRCASDPAIADRQGGSLRAPEKRSIGVT
jgi:RimJ/RimL family protein N-acetyltransferase